MTALGRRRLVALGDSISCGEGVGVRVPLERTWPALLAAALGATHACRARPGARVADVLAHQLEPAIARPPDIVTLFVGLNDVLWSRSCDVGADLTGLLRRLVVAHARVVVLRLHDPTLLLPLPDAARGTVRRRVVRVNAALDSAVVSARTRGPGTVTVVDLDGLPALLRRDAWAVDRLHPSEIGHARIAAAAGSALSRAGVAPVAVPCQPGPRTGRVAEAMWLARHGLPYLAVNGARLLPLAAGTLSGR